MFCLKHGRIKKKKKKKSLCWQEKYNFREGHWRKQQPKHRPLLFFSLNLTLLFLCSLYLCLTSPLSLFFHWPCLLLGLWVHFISSSLMRWKQFAETQYLFFFLSFLNEAHYLTDDEMAADARRNTADFWNTLNGLRILTHQLYATVVRLHVKAICDNSWASQNKVSFN